MISRLLSSINYGAFFGSEHYTEGPLMVARHGCFILLAAVYASTLVAYNDYSFSA